VNQATFVRIVDSKLLRVVADHAAALGVSPQDLGLGAGKRARPRFVHACAEVLGFAPEAAASWAALVEMVHVASLVHDDVIDGAELRRGRPSLRAREGNRRAVLGGDLFLSAAWLVASQELPSEVTAILARAMVEMTTAELRERDLLWKPDASLSCYLHVINGKTAALFAAAAEGTAALAGASPAIRRALTRCGRALGRAFQIQDDVRDYESTREAAGKDAMKDLKEGIVTLPLIIALRHDGPCAGAVRRYLVSRGQTELDPRALDGLLAESDALARSARVARRLLRLGVGELDGVVPTRAIRQLAMTTLGWTGGALAGPTAAGGCGLPAARASTSPRGPAAALRRAPGAVPPSRGPS
jgi:geranylgeranyl pyrophosphate synthase